MTVVRRLFRPTSCIRQDLVSRDSIVDGDWLPATEWCQRYLPCCQPASDIAKIWGGFFPVESYFSAICNHCRVMAAWSRKVLIFFRNFFVSIEKTILYDRIFKIRFGKFASRHRLTWFLNFVKFGLRKITEIVRCLPDKKAKFALLSAVATARIASKICHNQPRQCSQSAPNFIQIGSLSAELYPNAWTSPKRTVVRVLSKRLNIG